jgi:putative lipoprotein
MNHNTDEELTIEGTIGYFERILPPPDSRLIVKLRDVTNVNSKVTMASVEFIPFEKNPLPKKYAISIGTDALQSGRVYAVSGEIRDLTGALLWSSKDLLLEGSEAGVQSLGFLRLRRVSAENALIEIVKITGIAWRVEDIDGLGVVDNSQTTIIFEPDQSIKGSTGCNAYRADYDLHDGKLKLGTIALTKRACIPALANQEQAFLEVLRDAAYLGIEHGGALILKTSDWRSIRAHK